MGARLLRRGVVVVAAVLLAIPGCFFTVARGRPRPEARPATVHASLGRDACIDCHSPIAEEWRRSFHHRSLSGPFWARIREKGYAALFEALRVPCVNCHAPADVLDGPDGASPVERTDAVELGVDCVSCHVSAAGIAGPGRFTEAPHEVLADPRFQDPALASTALCARCHDEPAESGRVVAEWSSTEFANRGVTCVHCHMPEVEAPLVKNGPPRRRRSHEFIGDKRVDLLSKALNAALTFPGDRSAVLRITNDRVGHSLPAAGMNFLLVTVRVLDGAGRIVEEEERSFGTSEWIPGYLDFWPFHRVSKIPPGESREISVRLPSLHGTVSAEFRYRDWFTLKDRDVVFATMEERF